MTNVSDKMQRKSQHTFYVQPPFSRSRAVYEIMWRNMVKPDRPHDNIIRRMRFACWIPKATDTRSECLIFIAFPTMVARTCPNITLYVHCLVLCHYAWYQSNFCPEEGCSMFLEYVSKCLRACIVLRPRRRICA
jgi:hypothetical protein